MIFINSVFVLSFSKLCTFCSLFQFYDCQRIIYMTRFCLVIITCAEYRKIDVWNNFLNRKISSSLFLRSKSMENKWIWRLEVTGAIIFRLPASYLTWASRWNDLDIGMKHVVLSEHICNNRIGTMSYCWCILLKNFKQRISFEEMTSFLRLLDTMDLYTLPYGCHWRPLFINNSTLVRTSCNYLLLNLRQRTYFWPH